MTVNELIEQLQKIKNKDLPVKIEYQESFDDGEGYLGGYSCYSDIEDIWTQDSHDGKRVIISI